MAQPHNGALSADGRTAWVGSQQQGATALVKLDLAAGPRRPESRSTGRPRAGPEPGRALALVHGGGRERGDGAGHRVQPGRGPGSGRRVAAPGPLHARWALGARAEPGSGRARGARRRRPGPRGLHRGGQGAALGGHQLRRPDRIRHQRGLERPVDRGRCRVGASWPPSPWAQAPRKVAVQTGAGRTGAATPGLGTRAPARRRPSPIRARRTSGAYRPGGSRSMTTTSRRRSCADGRASACASSWRAGRRRCTT